MRSVGVRLAIACLLTAGLQAQAAPAAPQVPVEGAYAEGRRLFDTLDYENAIKALDTAIGGMQGNATDAARRDTLATAYEMRARSRFGIGDPDGARADFTALLKIKPDYQLTGQVSPRVVTLFDEVVQTQVTTLKLVVTPASAVAAIDGMPVQSGTLRVAVGDHVVTVDQRGYRPVRQTVAAAPGSVAELTVALERVSAALNILTSPPDVDVTLDGVSLGKTATGPPPEQFAAALTQASVAPTAASAVLNVPEVPPGPHVIRFSRPCHVSSTINLSVERADDYTVGPVKLAPSTAAVSIAANVPNAKVFVNGEVRGEAPLTLPAVCEGDYTLELRSPTGHYSSRLSVKTGEAQKISAVLVPAFAIVSSAGRPAGAGADLRVLVERALAPGARSVEIFAPPADRATAALEANKLPSEWLAFDANGRSLSASAQIVQALRGEASAKLADAFNAQGVGSVTLLDDGRIVLALLAAGSTSPDLIELRLDRPESVSAALDRLGRTPSFFQPTLGITAVDVADVNGAAVVGVDTPVAASSLSVGDVIVAANGKPVPNVAALKTLLEGRAADDAVTLEVAAAGGARKQVALKALMTPRLISMYEPALLANRLLLDLRARLAAATGNAALQSVIRLNLAVALARSGDWKGASDELQRVQLPAGSGVGDGAVQYLMGLAADQLGNRAEAEAALKKAMTSGGLVTENGPAIRELAEAKLAELQRPR